MSTIFGAGEPEMPEPPRDEFATGGNSVVVRCVMDCNDAAGTAVLFKNGHPFAVAMETVQHYPHIPVPVATHIALSAAHARVLAAALIRFADIVDGKEDTLLFAPAVEELLESLTITADEEYEEEPRRRFRFPFRLRRVADDEE